MTAQQLLDGINVIEKQLALFRISAHADRAAIDASVGVLIELAMLVRETKADELDETTTAVDDPEMWKALQANGAAAAELIQADLVDPVEDVLGPPAG